MVGHLKRFKKILKNSVWWHWLLVIFGSGVLFWERWRIIVRQPLWLDEVFVFNLARLPLFTLLQQVEPYWDYAHPPGFYVVMKLWLMLGHSEVWLRIPSLIFAGLSAYLLYRILDILQANYGKYFVIFYFATHWLMIEMGSELRMYQAVVVVMLAALHQLLQWWQQKTAPTTRQQIYLGLWLVGAIYLDYAALWLLIALSGVWFVAWWRNYPTTIWLGKVLSGVALLVTPQILILLEHFYELQILNQHLQFSGWKEFFLIFIELLSLPFEPYLALVVLVGVGAFWYRWLRQSDSTKSERFLMPVCLAALLVLPLLIVFIATMFGHYLLQQRNLVLVVLAALLIVSLWLDAWFQHLKLPWQKFLLGFAVLGVVGWNFFTFQPHLTNNWFWIRATVAQGYSVAFVGEREFIMEPFLTYYSQYPTALNFEYLTFPNLAALNQQPPSAQKILVIYETNDAGQSYLTKKDFKICQQAQCEVMGVR